MTPERAKRIEDTVKARQLDLAVILENVHDPHNIGAVLRTCDSVGIHKVYLLITDPQMNVDDIFLSKKASSGARRWLDVVLYTDLEKCLIDVRANHTKILGTKLNAAAKSLYEYDFTESVALAFGNEHDGLTDAFVKHLDGNIVIPQYGMVRSLNISVACAVTLFEALRQREQKKRYQDQSLSHQKLEILQAFEEIQEQKTIKNLPKIIE